MGGGRRGSYTPGRWMVRASVQTFGGKGIWLLGGSEATAIASGFWGRHTLLTVDTVIIGEYH